MGQILIVVAPPVALGVLLVTLALPTAPLWPVAEAGALLPVDRVARVTLLEVRAGPILPCKADQGILIQDTFVVRVRAVEDDRVKLGIAAPRSVVVSARGGVRGAAAGEPECGGARRWAIRRPLVRA